MDSLLEAQKHRSTRCIKPATIDDPNIILRNSEHSRINVGSPGTRWPSMAPDHCIGIGACFQSI